MGIAMTFSAPQWHFTTICPNSLLLQNQGLCGSSAYHACHLMVTTDIQHVILAVKGL